MKTRNLLKSEDETLDSFYRGSILVLQKKEGYRFSVDAPLLADFIQTKRSDDVLELGAGNGIISLLLSIKPFKHITAVEIQESLADMARRNVKLNNLERKISIIREDLRQYNPGKEFDVIFSNPPYIKKGEGHLSSSLEKSIAKHELKCDIFGILEKTAQLLKNKGRAYFIYVAKRKDDLFQAIEKNSLKIKSLRFVHPRQENPPNLLLVECDLSSEKEVLLPPFILYGEGGNYTTEAEEVFRGRINAEAD
ncbi:MAG: methyltransferase [Candidatus Aminicenantes bacterium]|nr:methyltransferase [Candidatus Aminicenantes bacterium]